MPFRLVRARADYLKACAIGRFHVLRAPWHDVRLSVPCHYWQRLSRGCVPVSDTEVPAARTGEHWCAGFMAMLHTLCTCLSTSL